MYSFEVGSDSVDGGDKQFITCNQPHLLDKGILADLVGLATTKQPSLSMSKTYRESYLQSNMNKKKVDENSYFVLFVEAFKRLQPRRRKGFSYLFE